MKKIIPLILRVIPHLTLILAAMFIVFWVLDLLNPWMNFVNCKISNKLLIILCISAIITSITAIAKIRKED